LCSCVDPKTGERKPANTYVYFRGHTHLVCASHPVPADCLSPSARSKQAQRIRELNGDR